MSVCVCVYHNLSKWTHLHDVLELLIHVSEGELACRSVRSEVKHFSSRQAAVRWCFLPCFSLSISSSLSSSFRSLTLSIKPSMSPIPANEGNQSGFRDNATCVRSVCVTTWDYQEVCWWTVEFWRVQSHRCVLLFRWRWWDCEWLPRWNRNSQL